MSIEQQKGTTGLYFKDEGLSYPGVVHLLFVGNWHLNFDLISQFYQQQFSLTLFHTATFLEMSGEFPQPALLIVELTAAALVAQMTEKARQLKIPWLAWNHSDNSDLTLAAYEAGASAVLPSSLPSAILHQAIQNILSMINHSLVDAAVPTTIGQRSYQREEVIRLEQDTVLEVLHGVVALTAIHSDGTQVLLGLYGPRQILVGYPEDAYCIQFLAYADTTILVHPWHEFAKEPACPELLLSRLRQMEAWASVQARPYLDQRLLGMLSLLAEQFGVPHAQGTLITVRITHAQLASALGATRTTITRMLGMLRKRGLLTSIGSGTNERFCLYERGQINHGLN